MIAINATTQDILEIEREHTAVNAAKLAALVASAYKTFEVNKPAIKEQLDYDDGNLPYSNEYRETLVFLNGEVDTEQIALQNINFANDINDVNANMFVGHAPFIAQDNADEVEQDELVNFNMALRQKNWQTSFYEMVRKTVGGGVGYYLVHNRDNDEYARFSKLDPLSTFVVCDQSIDPESLFGVYFVYNSSDSRFYWYVYTLNYLYKYSSKDQKSPEVLEANPIRHYFGRVPITEFKNNSKGVGDAYFVLDLIDLYCSTMNYGVIGYQDKMTTLLVLKDVAIGNQDEREQTRATIAEGVLPIMSQANGNAADAKYLETSYDIHTPKEFLTLIENKIYQLSHTFNFSNAQAVQSMGEPALKLMLKPTLDNAEVKERYYTPALKRVFKCALSYAEHTGNPFKIDIDKIDIIYSHPLPSNDQQAIANAVNLASAGLLNKKQVLRTISWIKDHDAYAKGIEEKPIEEIIKEEQGNNENNRNLQNANPELPEQNDNAANNATRIGGKIF